jgi:hypothetical protein
VHGYGMDGWNMGWMWIFGVVPRSGRDTAGAQTRVKSVCSAREKTG